jgi:hypothetical protein
MSIDQTIIRLGEFADRLLEEEKFEDALTAYQNVLIEINSAASLNTYFLSKVCLGLMIVNIKLSRSEKFAEIFMSRMGDPNARPEYAIGMMGLEKGLVASQDFLTYLLLESYFHAIRNDLSAEQKGEIISNIHSFICEEAIGKKDPLREIFKIAINRWRLTLLRLFNETMPPRFAQAIDRFLMRFDEVVPFNPKATFPSLRSWTPGEPLATFRPDGSVI